MAWKRKPKKVGSMCEFDAITASFLISDCEGYASGSFVQEVFESNPSLALVSSSGLPSNLIPFVEERKILGAVRKVIYLHAHQHARCVLTCLLHEEVPEGTIVTNQLQRVNQKLCLTCIESLSVYRGETFSFDAREASIGNTAVRHGTDLKVIQHMVLEIKEKEKTDGTGTIFITAGKAIEDRNTVMELDAKDIKIKLATMIIHSIVTVEELFLVHHKDRTYVLRLTALQIVPDEVEAGGEGEGTGGADALHAYSANPSLDEANRGLVIPTTDYFFVADNTHSTFALKNAPAAPPPRTRYVYACSFLM